MYSFDKYLSIGDACKTRHQIDRYFKCKYTNYQPSKGFFDWLWGPGIEGVTAAFRQHLKIHPSNLSLRKAGGTIQVQDMSTGHYFLHDFKFSDSLGLEIDGYRTEFLEQTPDFLKKYSHLATKTLDLITGTSSVCLVYHGEISHESATEFFSTMEELFSRRPFLLNIIQESTTHTNERNTEFEDCWITRKVNDNATKGTANEWKGVDSSWNNALKDFFINDR